MIKSLRQFLVAALALFTLAAFSNLLLMGVGSSSGPGSIITSAITYYVCAKANGGTCVYNGDAGTVAPTISDNNDCVTKATPCATINGVATKLNGSIVDAIVTVQLADTAGTGTDCYRPNNTIFQVSNVGKQIDTSLEVAETAEISVYPNAYIYLIGNTTTPANVIVTGATTCAGTTANDLIGVRFSDAMVRVRGIQAQYFKGGANGPDNGALVFYRSVVNAEDLNCTGDTTTTGTLIVAWEHSVVRLGSGIQWTITSCNVLDMLNYSHGSFISPLGRANVAVTLGAGWVASGGVFTANEGSHLGVDGMSLTVSGSGTAIIWFAISGGQIVWNDASTFVSPAITVSYNGTGITLASSQTGSWIYDACRTVGQLTCNIGNTTAISRWATASNGSYIRYLTAATSVNNADTVSVSSFIEGSATAISDIVESSFLVSTSTLTATSNTTLATVPGLSRALLAGKTYNCHGHLNGVSGASGGIKVAPVATGGLTATSTRFTGFTWNGITAVANTTVTALGSNIAANTAVYSDIYIDGSIVVNAAGTINIQAAQNASNATSTTVLVGSTFDCVRTN